MSRYRAGWLAIVAAMAILLCWITTAPVLLRHNSFGTFVLLSLLFWCPIMIGLMALPRCPTCRTSVFTAHKGRWHIVTRPWPSRRCCACGTRLNGGSIAPSFGTEES